MTNSKIRCWDRTLPLIPFSHGSNSNNSTGPNNPKNPQGPGYACVALSLRRQPDLHPSYLKLEPCSFRGVMVSMEAFHAFDKGSIPNSTHFFCLLMRINNCSILRKENLNNFSFSKKAKFSLKSTFNVSFCQKQL